MKILYIISSYSIYGGTPKKTLDLLKHFKTRSSMYVYDNDFIEFKSMFEQTGAHVYEGNYKRNLFLHIRKLLNIIDRDNIDIVQTQFTMGEILGGILKKLRPRIKLVIAFVGSVSPGFIKKSIVSKSYDLTDAFIYISNYVKEQRMLQFPILENKYGIVIYNGTEKKKVLKKNEFSISHPALVDLASLRDFKNISTLISAIQIIHKKMGMKIYLYVAGDGSERSILEDEIKNKDLDDYIHLLGRQRNVGQLIEECDVFVHPCHIEGFGIAVAEAMMAAKPIIVANSGGLLELIENEKSGLVVDPFDAQAWAKAIIRLLENSRLSQALGEEAKKRAQKMFSIEKCTANYEAFYSILLEDADSTLKFNG